MQKYSNWIKFQWKEFQLILLLKYWFDLDRIQFLSWYSKSNQVSIVHSLNSLKLKASKHSQEFLRKFFPHYLLADCLIRSKCSCICDQSRIWRLHHLVAHHFCQACKRRIHHSIFSNSNQRIDENLCDFRDCSCKKNWTFAYHLLLHS